MVKVIKKCSEMKMISKNISSRKLSIGMVPTMGFLHQGHLSLIKRSVLENDCTIVSIFVNPMQFGPNEDYEAYPRNIDGDVEMVSGTGADYVFAPSVSEMYQKGYNTFVDVFDITEVLCGAKRPGHFRGVCTVVAKLFNICRPDIAYFGQKDYQQCMVIKKMVKELDMDPVIEVCPIVREEDGLAMSSRNAYLDARQRKAAPCLYKALRAGEKAFDDGETDPEKILSTVEKVISHCDEMQIDYIEIRDAGNLSEIQEVKGEAVIAAAVKLGETRLIDNILIGG
jgi:pantoate--beta-alanine ligase